MRGCREGEGLFCRYCNHELAWSRFALAWVRAHDGGSCIPRCSPRQAIPALDPDRQAKYE